MLLVPAEFYDDPGDDADQYQRNNDRPCVVNDSLKHKLTLSGSVSWLPDTF